MLRGKLVDLSGGDAQEAVCVGYPAIPHRDHSNPAGGCQVLEPTFHFDRWKTVPVNTVFHASADALLWRLPPKRIDVIWTSPPYNLADKFRPGNYTPGVHDKMQYGVKYSSKGDGSMLPEHVYQAQQQLVLSLCYEALKPDGMMFYSHKVRLKDGVSVNPRTWIDRTPFCVGQEIIWNRGNTAQGDPRRLYPVYETIYLLTKQPLIKVVNNQSLTLNNPGKAKGGEGLQDVWYLPPKTYNEDRKESGHPAVTPPELVRRCLQLTGKTKGIVLDPYCGTGTTGIVAISMGFTYILGDSDEHWATETERKLNELRMRKPGNDNGTNTVSV